MYSDIYIIITGPVSVKDLQSKRYPILLTLYSTICNCSGVTRRIVRLPAAKVNVPLFPVLCIALSNFANIFILRVSYNFCLLFE